MSTNPEKQSAPDAGGAAAGGEETGTLNKEQVPMTTIDPHDDELTAADVDFIEYDNEHLGGIDMDDDEIRAIAAEHGATALGDADVAEIRTWLDMVPNARPDAEALKKGIIAERGRILHGLRVAVRPRPDAELGIPRGYTAADATEWEFDLPTGLLERTWARDYSGESSVSFFTRCTDTVDQDGFIRRGNSQIHVSDGELSPRQAREFAALLIEAADQIDGDLT